MRDYACTEDTFLEDVSNHVMTVINDDGINRHIRFRRPTSSAYWFDIITWPGSLCIDGDMGTYVFRRLEDMFEFFRTDQKYAENEERQLYIKPGYWGEKLKSTARHEGYTEFSKKLVCDAVKRWFDDWVESEGLKESQKTRLWEAIEEHVLFYSDDDPRDLMQAICDFEHEGFRFSDFWEVVTEDYTFNFIWCCYAIAWAVKTYDDSKSIEKGAA